jgi:hypothetical protein
VPHVTPSHRELVSPVVVAVSHQQVAALLGWRLCLPATQRVIEDFVAFAVAHEFRHLTLARVFDRDKRPS